jgi:Ni/Co efflux regulator RcnB
MQMMRQFRLGATLAALLVGGLANAEPPRGGGEGGRGGESHGEPQRGAPRGEPHDGPRGYQRVTEPHGWDARPASIDRGAYQHNFQAARSFHIGPYHRPGGWARRHWGYGQILPRAYWAAPYVLADYWLFALEVPPAGYEWVRDDSDALLVNTSTGEILQVEYGVFG